MKFNKYIIIIVLLSMLVLSCRRNPESSKQLPPNQFPASKPLITQKNDTNAHKYIIKSGIVTFNTFIAGDTGKKVLYFDNYGIKEREDYYEDDKIKESVITEGKIIYKVRYIDKTAFNMGNAQRGIAYKVDWNEIPYSQKRDGYAIKSDNMNIAGKVCEAYRIDNAGVITAFAGWGGICLYTQQKSKLGNAETKAIKIEENVTIPPDKFKLPKGIRINN